MDRNYSADVQSVNAPAKDAQSNMSPNSSLSRCIRARSANRWGPSKAVVAAVKDSRR